MRSIMILPIPETGCPPDSETPGCQPLSSLKLAIPWRSLGDIAFIGRVVVIDSAILRRTLVKLYKANDNPTTRDKVPIVAIAAVLGYFSRSIDDCVFWIDCVVYSDIRNLVSLCINRKFANVI